MGGRGASIGPGEPGARPGPRLDLQDWDKAPGSAGGGLGPGPELGGSRRAGASLPGLGSAPQGGVSGRQVRVSNSGRATRTDSGSAPGRAPKPGVDRPRPDPGGSSQHLAAQAESRRSTLHNRPGLRWPTRTSGAGHADRCEWASDPPGTPRGPASGAGSNPGHRGFPASRGPANAHPGAPDGPLRLASAPDCPSPWPWASSVCAQTLAQGPAAGGVAAWQSEEPPAPTFRRWASGSRRSSPRIASNDGSRLGRPGLCLPLISTCDRAQSVTGLHQSRDATCHGTQPVTGIKLRPSAPVGGCGQAGRTLAFSRRKARTLRSSSSTESCCIRLFFW